jgi:hypothetical protein
VDWQREFPGRYADDDTATLAAEQQGEIADALSWVLPVDEVL